MKNWKRILYQKQDFEDNYVDITFLDDLRTNLYSRTYKFWDVVHESGVFTQQLSSVCIFVSLYMYMNEGTISAELLATVSSVLTILGYVLYHYVGATESMEPSQEQNLEFFLQTDIPRTYIDDLKTAILFVTFTFALSAILMTLTETISTDTIYAMTTCLLLANLFFHDYGADAALVSQSLAVNAALFASVCLASRLHTILHTFTTVLVAMELFALFPILRRRLKESSAHNQMIMTTVTSLTATIFLYSISSIGCVSFVTFLLFVTFVCPSWLMRLQARKNNIHGPWDEAVVESAET